MKMNWPRYRLTLPVFAGFVLLASPAGLRSAPGPATLRVDAQVSAHEVRIETKASGPFEYTTTRPSDYLLVVDIMGVTSTEPASARVLQSRLVSSYRVLPLGVSARSGVRLEVLLRSPAEARVERQSPNQLTLIFENKPLPLTSRVSAPAPRVEAPAAVRNPLAVIAQVEVERHGQQASVRVEADGKLTYRAERLNNPERLVLDFSGAHLAVRKNSIPSTVEPVRGVRLSQFRPDVTRVVIDLERVVPYNVRAEGKTVTVEFAPVVPAAASGPVASAAPSRPQGRPAAARPADKAQPVSILAAPEELSRMPLPTSLTERSFALASPAPADRKPQGQTAVAANPRPVQGTQAPPTPAAQQPQGAAGQGGAKYSGEPISVNLKDVDLKDFFRLIHEISGLNVVLDPAVKGTVTLVLDDVPWDQALDIVMRNNNLDKELDGNVLRIATQETIKKEAETHRDLIRAQDEAVPQVTTTRVLSYAKASAMTTTLKKFLSSRGDILADERSNTLIIRDIPSVLPTVDNLIRQLDRKSQQVEIEARVVAASRSFARDIGTQFGFATTITGGRSLFGGLVGQTGFISPITSGGRIPPPLVTSGSTAMPFNSNLPAGAPTSGAVFAHRSPNFAVDFIISAAEAKGVGKLLSKPKVIAQNNEKSTVKQGSKIPVQTTINNTISVQFIDAVLKLEVTPQITAEGTVFMEVTVENTQVDQGIPRVQGIPALNTQSVEDKVLINDGGTVVIGGVIVTSQRTDISQVPLVGSLPVIGHLFRRTSVNVQSQELLFFLTPRILPS